MRVNYRFVSRLQVWLGTGGRILLLACLLLSAVANTSAAMPPTPNPGAAPDLQAPAVRHLVIENVGQYAAEARFLLLQGNQRIWLTDDAVWLTVPDSVAAGEQAGPAAAGLLHSARRAQQPAATSANRTGTAVRFTFSSAASAAVLEPFGRLPTHVSYLIGNDPARWQRDVPVWSGVRYRDLYPGVDLVIGGDASGTVPWRFEAQPGADMQAVTLRVEGAAAVAVEAGQLQLAMKNRGVSVTLPAWSLVGQTTPVGSTVVRQTGDGAFVVAPEAQGQAGQAPTAGVAGIAAVEDLVYSSFLGGSTLDGGYGIAVDYAGNAYVTGETASDNFPMVSGSYDTNYNTATDAFVAKFNVTGTALLYATYLGGTGQDLGGGIAVDGDLAYVVGETASTNFPSSTGSLGGSDIFVVALNATGSDLRYSRRLGGPAYDTGSKIAVDGTGAYLVGSTDSAAVSGTTGCVVVSDDRNLVVAKLDTSGAQEYVTCLGGSDFEVGTAIAVLNGAAYVTGKSWSSDFPGGGATGNGDILVARLDTNGILSNSMLVGGSEEDLGNGIAVDGGGNIYIAGTTASSPIATVPFTTTLGSGVWGGGSTDAVIVKLFPASPAIFGTDFATYLGGNTDDEGLAIAVDTVQGLYVAGRTTSNDFPVTASAYDIGLNGGEDAFAGRLHMGSSAPNKVTYATYLGGIRDDGGSGAATDTGGHAFIVGATASANFPTTGGLPRGGEDDAFVAKLKVSSPPAAPVVVIGASGGNVNLSWDAVGSASKYQVFRSSLPYFKPGDWSSPLPLAEPTGASYPDNVLTQVNVYFYVVKAVSVAPEAGANSNRVGKFTFQLEPGGS